MNTTKLAQQLERLSKAAAALSLQALRLQRLLLEEPEVGEPPPEPEQINLPEVEG